MQKTQREYKVSPEVSCIDSRALLNGTPFRNSSENQIELAAKSKCTWFFEITQNLDFYKNICLKNNVSRT